MVDVGDEPWNGDVERTDYPLANVYITMENHHV
jgi:hypothetical protein